MSDEISIDPRFSGGQGPDTFGPLYVPFVGEDGEIEEVLCAPADGSAGMTMTTEETTIAVLAYKIGDLGVYAPADAALLRTLAASFITMANELDAGGTVQ